MKIKRFFLRKIRTIFKKIRCIVQTADRKFLTTNSLDSTKNVICVMEMQIYMYMRDDPLFEQKITEAIQELNEIARAETYSKLQHYLTEELFPHIFGYHKTVYNVYASDLYDILYNPLGTFYAYPIKRNDTWSPFN